MANIACETRLMTDQARQFKGAQNYFDEHSFIMHGQGNYVSKVIPTIRTNTIDGFFSIFKRGMKACISIADIIT